MFIFHEGLPGCGKSYEAMVERIVPALSRVDKVGKSIPRKIFARIDGLNFEKIAELTKLDISVVRENLITVSESDVFNLYSIAENDSLVIIDELQNYWPQSRAKPDDNIVKWIAEHRHKGQDIVGMGQSFADVHTLFKRRCDRKIQFQKLSMLGKDNKYRWIAYQGSLNEKGEVLFKKVKSGTKTYDKKYFGSYSSYESGTDNTDTYSDDRMNVFKTPLFRLVLPLTFFAACFAVYQLFSFFDSEKKVNVPSKKRQTSSSVVVKNKTVFSNENNLNYYRDLVSYYDSKYEAKLVYLSNIKAKVLDAQIEWMDENARVQFRLDAYDFSKFGYDLIWNGVGVVSFKDDSPVSIYSYKVRVDAFASVPDDQSEQL